MASCSSLVPSLDGPKVVDEMMACTHSRRGNDDGFASCGATAASLWWSGGVRVGEGDLLQIAMETWDPEFFGPCVDGARR
jgi:hypothetical protein